MEGHEIKAINGSKKIINLFNPTLLIEQWIEDTTYTKKCTLLSEQNECKNMLNTLNMLSPSYMVVSYMPNGDWVCKPVK